MGLGYEWNPLYMGMAYPGPGIGLQGTDPTPVASHAVSADALEGKLSGIFLDMVMAWPGSIIGLQGTYSLSTARLNG